MPSASVTRFNPGAPRRRPRTPGHVTAAVEQVKHALTQLEIQSQYPRRSPFREAPPQSEFRQQPSAFDE